jgi:hypothetical protein
MTRETLAAEDAEDLQIISAKLQDAVARVGDLVWLPQTRRFAALFNRFKWEEAEQRKGDNLRVRSGLHFDGVIAAKSVKIMRGDPDAVLSLLAIQFLPKGGEDPGGMIVLVFAGGGAIKLDVENIDAELSDISGEWAAINRPDHSVEP